MEAAVIYTFRLHVFYINIILSGYSTPLAGEVIVLQTQAAAQWILQLARVSDVVLYSAYLLRFSSSVLNGQLFSTAQNIRKDILNILLINKHQMTKHGTTILKRIVSRLFNDGELMLTNVEDGVNLLGP